MPITTTQDAAEAILRRAHRALAARSVKCQLLTAYYDGEHPLEFASAAFRQRFAWLLQAGFADNWCQVAVDAKEERLAVEGFRVSAEVEEADRDAWRIWQANDMDVQAPMAHREALIHGEAYETVWVSEDKRTPAITVEHPSRAIVLRDPARPRRRRAGLRTLEDEDGHLCAELFLPDSVWTFRSDSSLELLGAAVENITWTLDTRVQRRGVVENPLGEVPMVPLTNKPRIGQSAIHLQSELWPLLPLQDMLNKLMVDLIVTSEYQSFRQRWATGLELEDDPETGKPKKPYKGDPGELWVAEDPGVKFGEFQTTDLAGYVKAQDAIIVHIASIGSIPPHYLNASADRLSGESIKAAESGLISKVRRIMTGFGDSHETVMRLAGRLAGIETLANATDMETIWGDPEIRTEAILADAASKRKDLGVPWGQTMIDLGYSPLEIRRMRAERAQEELMAALAAPPPAIPGAIPAASRELPPAPDAAADA